MAEMQPIPFGIQAYAPRSPALRLELAQNLYAEKSPEGAKGAVALIGTPGLRLYRTVGDGPIRGMKKCGNLLYVVSGASLYTVNSSGVTTELGGIGGSGPVQMIQNGTQVAITTSGPAYWADSTSVNQLPESNLNGCTYQDGYGLYTQADTENLFWSGLPEGTGFSTLDALDVTQADALPDGVVGLISDHREVWVFGSETIEVFINTGNSNAPFVRTGGGFIEHGCASGDSIAKAENMVFWLGEDGRVYSAQGYAAQPISTPAIEYELGLETDLTSARAFTYSQEGHTFYVLSTTNRSLVYDLTTGLWHKRVSQGLNRWRAGSFEKAFNRSLVGDVSNGKIYQLDLDYYSEDGTEIVRRTTSPTFYFGGRRSIFDELVLDIETGIGLVTGQGSDPQVVLDKTYDYGNTYTNERWRSFGAIGEYKKIVRWTGLGSSKKEFAYRLTISDPVPVRILGVYGRYEVVEA